MAINLQGSANYLQGNNYSLQGSTPTLQGSSQNVQGTPTIKKNTTVSYGNTAATSPAKQQYINSLKAYKYADDPTVYGNYNGNPDYAFTSEQEFKNAGGNFNNVETRNRPVQTSSLNFGNTQPTYAPTQQPAQPSALDLARQAYLKSFEPDTATTTAQQKYNDFVASEKLGETALEGQGRGIPLALVRGQQSKLNEQAQIEANRLQGEISIAQGNASLAQNKAKAALDFATADQTANKPLELASGSTLVKYNPTTGQYEQVAQGTPKPETLPASAQEYEYAKKNGYTGTYEQYQTEDANRKRSVTNVIAGSGLTSQQAGLFNNIVNKYQASPLISGADKTSVLTDTINGIRKDPGNGALQLNLAYQYVKALDTYQSAVREGELGLVSSIDSKAGQLQNYIQQINNGQQVRPEVAKQIADAAEALVNSITSAAKQKQAAYASQANTLGLGDAWNTYTSGFSSPANSTTSNTTNDDPLGLGF
jgi:hypothetical protein